MDNCYGMAVGLTTISLFRTTGMISMLKHPKASFYKAFANQFYLSVAAMPMPADFSHWMTESSEMITPQPQCDIYLP